MNYTIVRFTESDVSRVINFQYAVRKQLGSIKNKAEDFNCSILSPSLEWQLTYAAKTKLLYAALNPQTTEIYACMAGYSPGTCLCDKKPKRSQRLKEFISCAQYAVRRNYILTVHPIMLPEIEQADIFERLFDEIVQQARFFEFQDIVLPVSLNRDMQRYLSPFGFLLEDTYGLGTNKPLFNLFKKDLTLAY